MSVLASLAEPGTKKGAAVRLPSIALLTDETTAARAPPRPRIGRSQPCNSSTDGPGSCRPPALRSAYGSIPYPVHGICRCKSSRARGGVSRQVGGVLRGEGSRGQQTDGPAPLLIVQWAQGSPYVLPNGDAALGQDGLERCVERDPVEDLADLHHRGVGLRAALVHERSDQRRERGGLAADGADRGALRAPEDQGVG